jgi:hypothetical protein
VPKSPASTNPRIFQFSDPLGQKVKGIFYF